MACPVFYYLMMLPSLQLVLFAISANTLGSGKLIARHTILKGIFIAESYMRSLEKGLAALAIEDGRNWNLFLLAVALAYNSTPRTVAGFSPFLLLQGEKL